MPALCLEAGTPGVQTGGQKPRPRQREPEDCNTEPGVPKSCIGVPSSHLKVRHSMAQEPDYCKIYPPPNYHGSS